MNTKQVPIRMIYPRMGVASKVSANLTGMRLSQHLQTPTGQIGAVPFVDLVLIAASFWLMDLPFIASTGVTIDLPKAERIDYAATVNVLNIKQNGMLLYDGRILDLSEFEALLIQSKTPTESVLLVKANHEISAQTLLHVCDIAREAGFGAIQIAAEPKLENVQFQKIR